MKNIAPFLSSLLATLNDTRLIASHSTSVITPRPLIASSCVPIYLTFPSITPLPRPISQPHLSPITIRISTCLIPSLALELVVAVSVSLSCLSVRLSPWFYCLFSCNSSCLRLIVCCLSFPFSSFLSSLPSVFLFVLPSFSFLLKCIYSMSHPFISSLASPFIPFFSFLTPSFHPSFHISSHNIPILTLFPSLLSHSPHFTLSSLPPYLLHSSPLTLTSSSLPFSPKPELPSDHT